VIPDASFVIPVYNGEEYIANSIGSCIAQNHKRIEIIVVNDGSEDSTKRIIDWYALKDDRVVPIHLEKNGGSGRARNIGSSYAKSPYILMLDSDDESEKNRVTETFKVMRNSQNEKGCLVYGSCAMLDCLGNNIGNSLASEFNVKNSLEKKVNFIVHSSMAYPKSFWEKNPYDEDEYVKLGMEDWLFQWQAHFNGLDILHTEKILCGLRQNPDGQSMKRDSVKALELKEKFLKENDQKILQAA